MDLEELKKILISYGFFYNPFKNTIQRLKYKDETITSFIQVNFIDDNLSITESRTYFEKNNIQREEMYIVFYGKIPSKDTNFKSIIKTILSNNKIVNNDVVRHLMNNLESNEYNLIDKAEQIINNKTEFRFIFLKDIEDYNIEVQILLPKNNFMVKLINKESNIEIVMLDLYFPTSIPHLKVLLEHIPLLFYKTN